MTQHMTRVQASGDRKSHQHSSPCNDFCRGHEFPHCDDDEKDRDKDSERRPRGLIAERLELLLSQVGVAVLLVVFHCSSDARVWPRGTEDAIRHQLRQVAIPASRRRRRSRCDCERSAFASPQKGGLSRWIPKYRGPVRSPCSAFLWRRALPPPAADQKAPSSRSRRSRRATSAGCIDRSQGRASALRSLRPWGTILECSPPHHVRSRAARCADWGPLPKPPPPELTGRLRESPPGHPVR